MNEMNSAIFRAYDIRGKADPDLTPEVVTAIGKALASRAKERGVTSIAVGRDIRLSSPRLFENLTRGIIESGIDVKDLGVIPTPVLYFALYHFDMDTGVMITGSHNPRDQNGFKLCEDKQSLYGEAILDLKRRIQERKFTEGRGRIEALDPVPSYLEYMHKCFKFTRLFKIVIDPGNGATGVLLERLFSGFSALDVSYINLEPDGNFPVHLADPTVPEYMEELGGLVQSSGADLGLGFDGDGDRVGAMDETGTLLFGDKLLAILASEVIEDRPGAKIIFDVKCSQGIVDYIKELGGRPVMYKTGHSLLKAKLREEKAPLAGEMSGHVFYADEFFGYDDAMYVALRLLRLLERRSRPLSELADQIPSYINTPEIHVPCPDEKKFEVVRQLQAEFSREYETITIDGARVSFPDGWGLVRASNTQPVLVLRFEAKTVEALERIRELFFEKLRKHNIEPKEVL
ncbi:phosphomannomutase/phosphoglucomutase [candidate division WOR-3 bacterium]|nr:phosphomannomutase/phosphoglucomutase [candidate division WOR-3 bacterium]